MRKIVGEEERQFVITQCRLLASTACQPSLPVELQPKPCQPKLAPCTLSLNFSARMWWAKYLPGRIWYRYWLKLYITKAILKPPRKWYLGVKFLSQRFDRYLLSIISNLQPSTNGAAKRANIGCSKRASTMAKTIAALRGRDQGAPRHLCGKVSSRCSDKLFTGCQSIQSSDSLQFLSIPILEPILQ